MKISAPSFIIPATRAENVIYLKDLVDEVELLFFDSAHEFDMPTYGEINDLKCTGMPFSAHLPTDADLNTSEGWATIDAYINRLQPLNIRRFILHPVESGTFLKELIKRRNNNIIIENTDFYGSFYDDAINAGIRLCFDNAHAGGLAPQFLDKYSTFIDEYHLQGTKDGQHHKSLEYIGPCLLKSVFHKAAENDSTVCLEVFEKDGFLKSYEIFKGLS